jgi:ferrochelatase
LKQAVVLLNMGGARSKDELRVFLTNMFNDPNILTIKSDFLRSLVATMIVTFRVDKAWENYEAIGGVSPLHRLSDELVEKLQNRLEDTFVTTAMRYTPQFAQTAIAKIKEQGIKDVVLLPLYPQYSTTTTKSSVEDFIQKAGDSFNIKVIEPFYLDEGYNNSIFEDILEQRGDDNDFHLIFSAHGLPQKIVDKGDPYQEQLEEQLKLLKSKLSDKFESISLAYQSKVGPMKWLEPSLDTTLESFKEKKVIIYPIAFIIDNSETVFELEIEYRELAEELGVKEFKVCKCLNSNKNFVDSLINIIKE